MAKETTKDTTKEVIPKTEAGTSAAPKSETVQVPTETLAKISADMKEMMAEMAQLRKENEELKSDEDPRAKAMKEFLDPKNKDKIVTLARYEGQIVMGFVNKSLNPGVTTYIYQEVNPINPNEPLSFVDLMLEDGTTTKAPYPSWIDIAQPVSTKVLKTDVDVEVEDHGDVDHREVDDKGTGYNMKNVGVVPSFVKKEYRIYDVLLPDGKTLTIDEKYVNMLQARAAGRSR